MVMGGRTRFGDLVLAVLVVAITAMLLVPLPTWLIDILIVTNLSIALLLLLVGLYMPNSLSLLSFPTLLLLTTLFRLSLNVASSRLILANADAGKVIHAFGTFLIQGQLMVGLIIFAIVTIVNFIVIAKGSARVSEVSARFVLDALPGKQHTIDSDLRAGLITPEIARDRREDLRKESQLFGAMDGAMKFVQGDAVAGIFIIFTNILGGLFMGLSAGMGLEDALQTYTVLTVGDGLVSQIPALLISICAGIVVTRVGSTDQATLGADISAQLFSRPGTVMGSGAILVLVGFLPYIPFLPFAAIGLFLVGMGVLLRSRQRASPEDEGRSGEQLLLPGASPTKILSDESDSDGRVSINLDSSILIKLFKMQPQRYLSIWNGLRSEFLENHGFSLPSIEVSEREDLPSPSYCVRFQGSTICEDVVLLDSVMVEMNPDHAPAFGIEVLKHDFHPITGTRVFWANQTPALRRILDAAKIRTLDFFEVISLRIGSFFLSHPEEILHSSDIFERLKVLEKRHPGLMSEALGKFFLTVPKFTEVCHELVKQGLSIADFDKIVESVASYCATHRISPQDDVEPELADIVRHVRIQRKRKLLSQMMSPRRTAKMITVSNELDQIFAEAPFDDVGQTVALDPDVVEQTIKSLDSILDATRLHGVAPVVILCQSDSRQKISVFLRGVFTTVQSTLVVVACPDELDPTLKIERVGEWAIVL